MWQPIETAPKDGTEILLHRDCHPEDYRMMITVGFWGVQDIGPDNPGVEQWCDWAGGYEYDVGWSAFGATHWQPLPEPPPAQK